MIDMQKEPFNLIKEEVDCVEDQEPDGRITELTGIIGVRMWIAKAKTRTTGRVPWEWSGP